MIWHPQLYLFLPLKSALQGQNYNSAEEVQVVLEHWIEEKPQSFFAQGIRKLPEWWEKCVAQNGMYFEHITVNDE